MSQEMGHRTFQGALTGGSRILLTRGHGPWYSVGNSSGWSGSSPIRPGEPGQRTGYLDRYTVRPLKRAEGVCEMATFQLHQVKENGMAEYRQPGNTATVRFGKTFWKEGTVHPQEVSITLADGTSIQDLVGVGKERAAGVTDEEKAAKAAEKEAAKAAKAAEREAARATRKAERDAERASKDEERAKAREERKAERDAERAAREAAGESVEEVPAEM